jgi:hypothetical protein
MKIEGSASESGSFSQRHRSADPDPDSHQNVMDLEHWDPGWKKFGSGIRDGKNSDPVSGMENSLIRDKQFLNIPEMQHCSAKCFENFF